MRAVGIAVLFFSVAASARIQSGISSKKRKQAFTTKAADNHTSNHESEQRTRRIKGTKKNDVKDTIMPTESRAPTQSPASGQSLFSVQTLVFDDPIESTQLSVFSSLEVESASPTTPDPTCLAQDYSCGCNNNGGVLKQSASSVCIRHKKHYHSECMPISELANISIGDNVGGKKDQTLHSCGCCDPSLEKKKKDRAFCQAVPMICLAPEESNTPTISPSKSVAPSISPSTSPSKSVAPSISPSKSVAPSISPSKSVAPSMSPSKSVAPSMSPSKSVAPSMSPSNSVAPSMSPSNSVAPSMSPSKSAAPSMSPSNSVAPSTSPSNSVAPSTSPSNSVAPSLSPSKSSAPSMSPSSSSAPSSSPSKSAAPSMSPSKSVVPSVQPSTTPTRSAELSNGPSLSATPSVSPSTSTEPSAAPSKSAEPSASPSKSTMPSMSPSKSANPSESPSKSTTPSVSPSTSTEPSAAPSKSAEPSASPSKSANPSESPSKSAEPSASPSKSTEPSLAPSKSIQPSASPSKSNQPSMSPSKSIQPSASPSTSNQPSMAPSKESSATPSKATVPMAPCSASHQQGEVSEEIVVQPRTCDEVHAVWVHGPSHSAQLSPWWPSFGSGVTRTDAQCTPTNPDTKFTGYNAGGAYCRPASSALDDNPHLVMYSGKIGLVLDASAALGSVFRQFGATGQIPYSTDEVEGVLARDVYSALPFSNVEATAALTCSENGVLIRDETIIAMLPSGVFAELGLVRQGHAVTQVTIEKFEWMTAGGDPFDSSDSCNLIDPSQDPNHIDGDPAYRCNSNYIDGVTADSCRNPLYPICKGYTEGIFGSCFEDSTPRDPNFSNTCTKDYYTGFYEDRCQDPNFPLCTISNTCSAGAPVKDPSNANCNQNYLAGNSYPCPAAYPECVGFQPGVRWGKCYSSGGNGEDCTQNYNGDGPCTSPDFTICRNDRCYKDVTSCVLPDPWFDVTMWGNSVAIHFHWDGSKNLSCTGTVQLSVETSSGIITRTADFNTENRLAVLIAAEEGSSSLTEETTGAGLEDVIVTSSSSGAAVIERTDFGDVVVEVPTNTRKCSYTHCGNVMAKVDISATNSNPDEARPVRLTLSRNFPIGYPGIAQSRPGAEITGLSIMVWDRSTQQPNGMPIHISKNWHSGYGSNVYAGTWWTANLMFYLPPGSSKDLTFAIAYEQFKGIPAWSHAQLSIVGYSSKWLWEECALGTGGENFVMDPLGSHTRAVITDVRPKLFDGDWKENVGGGDFLLYHDNVGALQYKKELDARLHSNGPCLSNATYTSLSSDGAIKSEIQISGARTDDLVRVFLHVKHTAVQDTSFSRLSFFQMGAETYNYHSNFETFVFGNEDGITHDFPRTCNGYNSPNNINAGTSRRSDDMYDSINSGQNVYREPLSGQGPWWFSMATNTKDVVYSSNKMVVGDKGLVIRSYNSKLGGVSSTTPNISILCQKVEIGTPAGLSSLQQGDFVDMRLEMIILPREGIEFEVARGNSASSNALSYLSTFSNSWERVQAQAMRDITVTSVSTGGWIESHYPVRVCVPDGFDINQDVFDFTIEGEALGFVPIVICNLPSSKIPAGTQHGLWEKKESEADFTLLTSETDARQANYMRFSETFELVFNVEIMLDGSDTFTQYSFGFDPGFTIV